MRRLSDVLNGGSVSHKPNSVIQRRCDEAAELARFQYPTTRIVGFVGSEQMRKVVYKSRNE